MSIHFQNCLLWGPERVVYVRLCFCVYVFGHYYGGRPFILLNLGRCQVSNVVPTYNPPDDYLSNRLK